MNAITVNTEVTMSSLDFLRDYINPSRELFGESALRNTEMLRKITDELDLTVADFLQATPERGGTPQKFVMLDHDQMLLVGMRESKQVRRSVLSMLRNLRECTPVPPPVEPIKHPLVVKAEAIRDIHEIVKNLDISIYEYAKRQLFPDLLPNRVEAVRIPPPSQTAVDEFLSLRCIVDPQGVALSKDIYAEYKKLGGVLSHNGFSRQLTSRGFYRYAASDGRSFRGLRLK